jgi:hypothetical protein
LADDIKANGQQQAIVMRGTTLLDGRNRLAACKLAKVEPKERQYAGNDPVGFIISANLHRRHLTESQRAMVAAKMETMRQGERTDIKEPCANLHKVPASDLCAKCHHPKSEHDSLPPNAGECTHKDSQGNECVCCEFKAKTDEPAPAVSRADAAKLLNVSVRSVADAKAIQRESPKLAAQVASGKKTVHAAKKEIKSGYLPRTKEEIAAEIKQNGFGLNFANAAIGWLDKIPPNDPTRNQGIDKVQQWITDHR